MRRNRARLGAIVVSSAMLLAACSSSSSSTTAAGSSAPAPTSAPSTGTQGANPGGDFCTLLKAEKAKFAKLGKTLSTAFTSPDFTSTKKTLTVYFDAVAQAVTEVEASMSSAPADVQAALQTINQYIAQLKTAVANSSSLTELEAGMSSAASTAKLKTAGATLKAYTTSQCGDLSSPTP